MSQGQILANFTQANTIFGEDHYTFNDASGLPPGGNQGYHKHVTLVSQGADPVTGASSVDIYNKSGVVYARLPGAGAVYPLFGTFLNAQNGYVQLFGDIILQWGFSTLVSGTSTQAVVFPIAFNAAGWTPNILSLIENPISTGTPHDWGAISITNTGFTAKVFGGNAPNTVNFNWSAIGTA